MRFVLDALVAGRLKVPIEDRYPLAEVTEMHRRLETRGVSGKLLLELTRSD